MYFGEFIVERHLKIQPLICSMINVILNLQKPLGDINFKGVENKSSGLWQSQVCINAQTGIFHTENNCTYTLISVPNYYITQ